MDFFVATRLHSAIFAMSVGVPVLCIGYLPKSEGVLKMMNLTEYALSIDQVDPTRLMTLFDKAWPQRQPLGRQIVAQFKSLGHQSKAGIALWFEKTTRKMG
jgi:colanic acid/amylovoran biosynthesis protein